MLIYNHKKEFVGIDTDDLHALGYSDLGQLLNECDDFAQLFVKTPGFIHDFKHVHWIDFITCAQSNEDAKTIIHANGKNYKAVLQIENFYLLADPSHVGYEVRLQNLRELTKDETQKISDDILHKPTKSFVEPQAKQEIQEVEPQTTPESTQEVLDEPEELQYEEENYSLSVEEDPYDIDTKLNLQLDEEIEEPLQQTQELPQEDESDFKLDLNDIHQEDEPLEIQTTPPQKAETKLAEEDPGYENDYVYDPNVASEELGLPLDLIEEFIQDFINQAYEFKEELYTSLENGEIDNVRILSHKLKGVAANLRIEDAFDVLVIVNTSDDISVVSINLNRFYKIISKLAGEEIPTDNEASVPQGNVSEEENISLEENTPSDDLSLEFKEEELLDTVQEEAPLQTETEEETSEYDEDIFDIDDSNVPEKIDIVELADDDFIEAPAIEEETELLHTQEEPVLLDLDETPQDQPTQEEYSSTYEKSSVAGELGLDNESFDFLFKDFIQDANELIGDLQTSLQDSNLIQARKAAIKIKGMSDNMRVNDFKKELEELISSQDLVTMAGLAETIKMKLNALSRIED